MGVKTQNTTDKEEQIMVTQVTAGLTTEEETLVISLLCKVSQPWSPAFFNAIKQQVAMTAIEIVIMRSINNRPHVLLTVRPDNDPNWPGELHSPGSMLRGADIDQSHTYDKAFSRVLREIGIRSFSQEPVLVDAFPVPTPRGPENGMIFIAEIIESPTVGKFYDLEEVLNMPTGIPGGVIAAQLHMLRRMGFLYVVVYPFLRLREHQSPLEEKDGL